MKVEWEGKIGPAAVLTVLAFAANIGVYIWITSAFVTKVTSKVDEQGAQIKEYRADSDKRFALVGQAIKETREAQAQAVSDVTSVKTAVAYISEQVRRVESRLDGTTPPAPSIQPPKQ